MHELNKEAAKAKDEDAYASHLAAVVRREGLLVGEGRRTQRRQQGARQTESNDMATEWNARNAHKLVLVRALALVQPAEEG